MSLENYVILLQETTVNLTVKDSHPPPTEEIITSSTFVLGADVTLQATGTFQQQISECFIILMMNNGEPRDGGVWD